MATNRCLLRRTSSDEYLSFGIYNHKMTAIQYNPADENAGVGIYPGELLLTPGRLVMPGTDLGRMSVPASTCPTIR